MECVLLEVCDSCPASRCWVPSRSADSGKLKEKITISYTILSILRDAQVTEQVSRKLLYVVVGVQKSLGPRRRGRTYSLAGFSALRPPAVVIATVIGDARPLTNNTDTGLTVIQLSSSLYLWIAFFATKARTPRALSTLIAFRLPESAQG